MQNMPNYNNLPQALYPVLMRSWDDLSANEAEGGSAGLVFLQLPLDAFPSIEQLLQQPERSVGQLVAQISNCQTAALVYFMQCPLVEHIDDFYTHFHNALDKWYDRDLVKPDILGFVHTFTVAHLIALSTRQRFNFSRRLLLPYSPQAIDSAYMLTYNIAQSFLQRLLSTFLLLFKQHWSTAQFERFAQGLVDTVRIGPSADLLTEDMHYSTAPPNTDFTAYLANLGVPFVQFAQAERELGMLALATPRVPHAAFCRLAPPPEDALCPICQESIDAAAEEGLRSVVTQCRHFFHLLCLDSWVNESGQDGARTCPSCRAVMTRITVDIEEEDDEDDEWEDEEEEG